MVCGGDDADSLEDLAALALKLGSNCKAATGIFDVYLLDSSQVVFDLWLLEAFIFIRKALIQLFAQHQGQKAAEHVTPDGLIPLVIDGPRLQNWLHRAEEVLHHPQFFIG